ncbi:MAG: recombinase family protein [Ostreibacterium sp.]
MSYLYAYLRASTKEQNASRAKEMLDNFASEHNSRIAAYFIENASGAALHRPELMKLLDTTKAGDTLLVESIDRLTRMHNDDWDKLKALIHKKHLNIVAIDLPTTYLVLKGDALTDAIMSAINQLIIDILAAVSRKDYLRQRERQRQGIARAQAAGRYKGRPPDYQKQLKIQKLLQAGMTYSEVSALTGASRSTIARAKKLVN